jgi:lipoate synthase
MTVIIRKSGWAYIWTCTTMIQGLTGARRCDFTDVAESEAAAMAEYDRHKKTTRGH